MHKFTQDLRGIPQRNVLFDCDYNGSGDYVYTGEVNCYPGMYSSNAVVANLFFDVSGAGNFLSCIFVGLPQPKVFSMRNCQIRRCRVWELNIYSGGAILTENLAGNTTSAMISFCVLWKNANDNDDCARVITLNFDKGKRRKTTCPFSYCVSNTEGNSVFSRAASHYYQYSSYYGYEEYTDYLDPNNIPDLGSTVDVKGDGADVSSSYLNPCRTIAHATARLNIDSLTTLPRSSVLVQSDTSQPACPSSFFDLPSGKLSVHAVAFKDIALESRPLINRTLQAEFDASGLHFQGIM